MNLRPYQVDAKSEIRSLFVSGQKRVILCSPTGSGKTVTFASIAQDTVAKGRRVVICVDRKELLEQAQNKLTDYGVNSVAVTGGKRPSYRGFAFVATVQTLLRRDPLPCDLLIIDEAHKQTFDKVLERPEYKDVFVIGATATPYRSGKMTQLSDLYNEMVETVTIAQLVDEGFLADCRTFGPSADSVPNMSKVKTKGGDYDSSEMFNLFNSAPLYAGVVEKYKQFAHQSRAICFNVNVEHSKKTREAFAAAGYRAAHVDGSMRAIERENILFEFSRGYYDVLCNCDLFTTGFDEPSIETVIVNRATKSLPLWLQMVGRGSRPFKRPDGSKKTEFKVLDMGGNVYRLGSWQQPREWSLTHRYRESEQPAPVKECKLTEADKTGKFGCGSIIPASATVCSYCGYCFEKKNKELIAAEFAEILQKTITIVPEHLKGDMAKFTLEQLEEYRKLKGYAMGWLVRQVAARPDLSIEELAKFKGYKRQWIDLTVERLKAQTA